MRFPGPIASIAWLGSCPPLKPMSPSSPFHRTASAMTSRGN